MVVGPTASGKSDLALQLAQKYNGEIICADSRTVYKDMDIGTAKPSKQDQLLVPHHAIDLRKPNEPFNAAEFKKVANQAIKDIAKRGKLPIMVGGTGLYIDAVIFDYKFGEAVDVNERKRLNELTVEELHEICSQKNIELPTNHLNKRHLVRAIEMGGLLQHKKNIRDNTLVVGLSTEKDILRIRIEQRAAKMVEAGVLDETRRLGNTYGWESEAMKGNIYPIFYQVIEGKINIAQALKEVVRSDLKLAKRQLTWFKRNQHIIWGNAKDLILVVSSFVKKETSL